MMNMMDMLGEQGEAGALVGRAVHEVGRTWSPIAFATSCGLNLDPWQQEVVTTAGDLLLNCSRQAGKSTVSALLAVHTALYVPRSLTLIVSPTQRQSGETFRRCLDLYTASGRPIPAHAQSQLQLELANRSRIVALPGTEGTVRSYSGVNVLILDEASRIEDALWHTVTPMLAVSGGRTIALSTPFGTRGWWYEEVRRVWEARGAGVQPPWRYWEVPATACPRIPADYLAAERSRMGAWWFDQEYGCQFLDAQTAAFTQADIDRAFSEDYETWPIVPWTAEQRQREREAAQQARP